MRETSQVILDGIDAGLHYGAQLYVSMKGKPVAEIAFGEASDGVPMQNDTIMHWYSAVKPVVAMGIGLLMENGELELDHPVARFIPLFGSQGKESAAEATTRCVMIFAVSIHFDQLHVLLSTSTQIPDSSEVLILIQFPICNTRSHSRISNNIS